MALLKSSDHKLKQGYPCPDFTLKNIDGKDVSLSDFEGKVVIVIFMCNHCPYVIPKLYEISRLQGEYASEEVIILCVNSNDPIQYPADSYENMKKLAKEQGLRYYLFDETQEVARSYGAVCTPDPFLLDRKHRLAYHGRINDAMEPDETPSKHELREALDIVLAGGRVKKWFEPSQGCSIKWK